jgi:hypothetical protein
MRDRGATGSVEQMPEGDWGYRTVRGSKQRSGTGSPRHRRFHPAQPTARCPAAAEGAGAAWEERCHRPFVITSGRV